MMIAITNHTAVKIVSTKIINMTVIINHTVLKIARISLRTVRITRRVTHMVAGIGGLGKIMMMITIMTTMKMIMV